MGNIRRWYFYIVSAISLQVVTWAAIVLLRDPSTDTIAFQAAVIIVGLPLFLLHWRWATRSEGEDDVYGEDNLRLLYLFTMLTAFLIPIIFNFMDLLGATMRVIMGIDPPSFSYGTPLPNGAMIRHTAVAIVVLTILGLYHVYLLREEKLASDQGQPAAIRRLFVYIFTTMGLFIFAFGLIAVIRWLRTELNTTAIEPSYYILTENAAQVITGLLVWLPFWWYAGRLFHSGSEEERESALRKAYLYLVLFLATITVVSDLTIIGATYLRRLLDLDPPEDTGLVLASLITGAVLWAFHALVLREDSQAAPGVAAQANIRRVYWYLVAAVGLLALLIGLGSNISVIINALGRPTITDALREQLAWSTAALIAGIPVWIIPWRKIQLEVALPDPEGIEARSAGVRRYYLYGFILIATLTFLVCMIFIIYTILSRFLGSGGVGYRPNQIPQAIAYALMAVFVWIYHGSLLRKDNEKNRAAKTAFGDTPTIAVLDDGDGRLGQKLGKALALALPAAELRTIGLTPAAREFLTSDNGQPPLRELLQSADIVVGPWTVATPYAGPQPEGEESIAAIGSSPAHKVLIPTPGDQWDWAGLAGWQEDKAIRQTVDAVQQVIAGEPVVRKKPLGIGRIFLIVMAILILILIFFSLASELFGFYF